MKTRAAAKRAQTGTIRRAAVTDTQNLILGCTRTRVSQHWQGHMPHRRSGEAPKTSTHLAATPSYPAALGPPSRVIAARVFSSSKTVHLRKAFDIHSYDTHHFTMSCIILCASYYAATFLAYRISACMEWTQFFASEYFHADLHICNIVALYASFCQPHNRPSTDHFGAGVTSMNPLAVKRPAAGFGLRAAPFKSAECNTWVRYRISRSNTASACPARS